MSSAEQLAAERFQEQTLAQIRREFYRTRTETEFFQERAMLLRAITHPSDWLKQRGIDKMSAAAYRQILTTVLTAIRGHGRPAKVLRFSAYFLHCVQEHMNHHGEEYYEAAKAERADAGAVASKMLRKLQPGEAAEGTFLDILVAVHRTVKSKGGRKRQNVQALALTPDLFEN